MSQKRLDDRLHLPSLSIKGFRGIKELSIERLGRVTLLAGKNSVGKTTVLDAVQVYAARGSYEVLSSVLESHEEVAALTDGTGQERVGPYLEVLFHGRDASQGAFLSIGPNDYSDQLVIEAVPPEEDSSSTQQFPFPFLDPSVQTFKIVFQGQELTNSWFFSPYALSTKIAKNRRVYQSMGGFSFNKQSTAIACQSIGPELLTDNAIVKLWDTIALTEDEDRIINALQPILGDQVKRIAIIGDDSNGRRVVAKIQDQAFPVPLKSLGDGALRLFGVALVLINSRDGFLLIDEAENGIHHSIQPDFWRMVFKTAHANNVQVIATTHSFDCVRGFAQAAVECEEAEGVLVRIERKDEEMWAVEYSERNLKAAAKQHIEVR